MKTDIKFPIDFVISWVDNSDCVWEEKRKSFLQNPEEISDASEERYRDFGFFEFLLKSIQKYTPWVNHVYIVTDDQIPSFLPKDNRFSVVDHKKFIPNEYLPTFNSSVIELYLNNIPGLSEHFVYFNDDMLINKQMDPVDFFDEKGKPKDSFLSSMLQPQDVNFFEINNARVINRHFSKSKVIKSQFKKLFSFKYNFSYLVKTSLTLPFNKWSTFKNLHVPYSLCKSEYKMLERYAKEELIETSGKKFRSKNDINIWLLQDIRYCLGEFTPRSTNIGHYMNFDDYKEIIHSIDTSAPKLLVINDDSQDPKLDRIMVANKIKLQLIKKFNNEKD